MSDDRADDGEGVLRRWSRRKRAARQSAEARAGRGAAAPIEIAQAPPATTPATGAGAKVAALTPEGTRPRSREEEETIRDLPPVENLGKDSDYAAFLKKGVPEDLKRQALRKLWATDPQFNVVDPFTEYGGDYTKLVPLDPLQQTIYKVGLGFLNQTELDAQKSVVAAKEGVDEGETADAGKKEPVAKAEAEAEIPQASEPQTVAVDASSESPNTEAPTSSVPAQKDTRSS